MDNRLKPEQPVISIFENPLFIGLFGTLNCSASLFTIDPNTQMLGELCAVHKNARVVFVAPCIPNKEFEGGYITLLVDDDNTRLVNFDPLFIPLTQMKDLVVL